MSSASYCVDSCFNLCITFIFRVESPLILSSISTVLLVVFFKLVALDLQVSVRFDLGVLKLLIYPDFSFK